MQKNKMKENSETDYFLKSRKHEKNVYINTSSHRSAMLYTYSWKAIYNRLENACIKTLITFWIRCSAVKRGIDAAIIAKTVIGKGEGGCQPLKDKLL